MLHRSAVIQPVHKANWCARLIESQKSDHTMPTIVIVEMLGIKVPQLLILVDENEDMTSSLPFSIWLAEIDPIWSEELWYEFLDVFTILVFI